MLAEVSVERDDGGDPVGARAAGGQRRVRVRWTWAGERATRVTVSSGTSLDGADHDGPVVVEGADEVVVEVPAHPRRFFRVAPPDGPAVVVAERLVAVAGTRNFRDLGGYRGEGGRRVRWGLVYRSDNFGEVAEEGWAQLASLGVREVFDLRHDAERTRDPSRFPEHLGLRTTVLAIGGEAAEAPDVVELLASGSDFGLDFMVATYRSLVAERAGVFGTLLTHLSDTSRLPAVFHCTAGKDRTGVAAALLLSALGVARETVLDDYELTTRYRSGWRIEALRPRLEAAGVDVEAVRPFLSAPRAALEAAFAVVDAEHGSVGRFLADAAGVASDALARLRRALLA